jgi:hypothetical protein
MYVGISRLTRAPDTEPSHTIPPLLWFALNLIRSANGRPSQAESLTYL